MSHIEFESNKLTGIALDWAIAQVTKPEHFFVRFVDEVEPILILAEGPTDDHWAKSTYNPSQSWEITGPLIQSYEIGFMAACTGGKYEDGSLRYTTMATVGYRRTLSGKNACGTSDRHDYLEAACRALVIARLGDSVHVPASLVTA